MRVDASAFVLKNTAASKAPRFVVKLEYTSPLYLSSHDDIASVPSTHIAACLIEPSITSQKLNPDQGRAEIGAASFTVADKASAFTSAINTRLAAGEGLRGITCRFYLGYEGVAWSDFVLVGTQIVKEAIFEKGSYRVSCNDVQRQARKDVFDLASTTIAATVEAADTTITVSSTTGFVRVQHGTSWSDAPSSTVGYFKIKDEIIRYTGLTATTFTGCTRGALGTQAGRYVADTGTPAARREKVTEYVYLELPGPKLIYAILTGVLYDDSATLPTKWHLGIDEDLVTLTDFTGIGSDLWDTTDDAAGVILRFEGLVKTDGKAFIELELLRLMGLYMPVYNDGTLGLKRMTRVLADAAGVLTLSEANSVAVGDLQHDMDSLHNSYAILWNWNGKDFTRTTQYIDAASAAIHGQAPVMELKFKGLYGGRHTDGLVLKMLDSIRDRYSAPPVRLAVEVRHSLNTIEIGDVVRVKYSNVRDFTTAATHIDRAFEVQSVSVNHRTGAVSLSLFGSTGTGAAIEPPTAETAALPDEFYTATGTNLASVWTITAGVVSGGPYTLAGGTDLTASGSIWYYSGDLTIPAGVTVNLTGNVQIRCLGYLTINGTLNGVGGGHAGVADNASATDVIDGTPGYVGNSRGLDGCYIYTIGPYHASDENIKYATFPPATTVAQHAAFPYLALEVDIASPLSATQLLGLPTDLRGTGGGPGGKVATTSSLGQGGGTGAAGGAGLCTISRGFGVGAGALIDLSGNDPSVGTAATYNIPYPRTPRLIPVKFYSGTGGAGGPGAYLCLIDGDLLSAPDLSGRFRAISGYVEAPVATTTLDGTEVGKFNHSLQPFAGYLSDPSVISSVDYSFSAQRIQYIPAPEDAIEDTDSLAPPSNITASQSSSGYVVSFDAPVGALINTIYEVFEHTSSTPFSSAVKKAEGEATNFFIPRGNTTTVYIWVRAKYRDAKGSWIYSSQVPATDGIPAKAAATAGTYAAANPTSLSAAAANSTITTGSCTASLVGDTATTYSWARQSGSTSISANSASAATTTFTATGVAADATVSAVFRCTINSTYTVDVPVDCENITSTLAASASPTNLSKTEDAATITTASTTVTPTGGAGGYTYSWAKVSGGSITAVSNTSATTTFQATTMAAAETRTATFRCTVTDSASATATADVSITITRQGMTVTLSPTSLYTYGGTTSITSQSVTATPADGTAPYSYAWTKTSGDSTWTINSPSSATTTFTRYPCLVGSYKSAVFRCTVTDDNSNTAYAEITCVIERADSGG